MFKDEAPGALPLRQWLLLATLLQSACAPAREAEPALVGGKLAARQLWLDYLQRHQQGEELMRLVAALDERDYPDRLRRQLDASEQWCRQDRCRVLSRLCADYPPLLATIPDPPPLLFIHGDVAALARPQLAVVGTRKPSSAGKRMAQRFAAALCGAGYAVTSGLALGIDAAAHEGALLGRGVTIAVLGTGLDRVYPAQHAALAATIAQQGALVSELLPGSRPLAWHFPRRNRIISGMAHGVLVVEAALRSGSLITARMAGEQGREIFAIPGPIDHALSRGCHRLLREGAVLVESVDDILAELGGLLQWEQGRSAAGGDREELSPPFQRPAAAEGVLAAEDPHLLALLDYQPMGVDELVRTAGLAVEVLLPRLLQLELLGLVECRNGAWLRAAAPPHEPG